MTDTAWMSSGPDAGKSESDSGFLRKKPADATSLGKLLSKCRKTFPSRYRPRAGDCPGRFLHKAPALGSTRSLNRQKPAIAPLRSLQAPLNAESFTMLDMGKVEEVRNRETRPYDCMIQPPSM
ncbi:MAG: hypothetical protein R3E09_14815 [Novosphingobium sp.]|nr:hypothetical protein [Novosphingobium sp.]